MENIESLSRQRLDFSTGPKGETVATLTITLGNGSVHRYSASVDDEEYAAYGAAISAAEARQARIEGVAEVEIAGVFSSVASAFKKVYRGAQKVASSKVFKMAGKGLMIAAPAMGPFAPAAFAVAGGMQTASQLSDASLAAEAKAKRVARALTKGAKKGARKASGGSGRSFAAIMRYANRRRKGANRRAVMRSWGLDRWGRKISTGRKKKIVRRKKAVRRKKGTPSPVRAAKRGTLRSNKPGGVTTGELKRAARLGRIFWVA